MFHKYCLNPLFENIEDLTQYQVYLLTIPFIGFMILAYLILHRIVAVGRVNLDQIHLAVTKGHLMLSSAFTMVLISFYSAI